MVEVANAKQFKAIGDAREEVENDEVPEQDVQQERYITEGFDINPCSACRQGVAGQKGDPDEKADNRTAGDREDRGQQCVRDANEEHTPIGVIA